MTPLDASAVTTILAALCGQGDIDTAHGALDHLATRVGLDVFPDKLATAHEALDDVISGYCFTEFELPWRRVVDVPGCDKAGIT